MKSVKQHKTQIIILAPFVSDPPPPKKPKISPLLLKIITLTVITTISWLSPEAIIAIGGVQLFFILLEWLNQNKV